MKIFINEWNLRKIFISRYSNKINANILHSNHNLKYFIILLLITYNLTPCQIKLKTDQSVLNANTRNTYWTFLGFIFIFFFIVFVWKVAFWNYIFSESFMENFINWALFAEFYISLLSKLRVYLKIWGLRILIFIITSIWNEA